MIVMRILSIYAKKRIRSATKVRKNSTVISSKNNNVKIERSSSKKKDLLKWTKKRKYGSRGR